MKNLCRQGRWSQHLFWCILPFLCWKQVGQGAVDSKQIQWGRLLAAASITSCSSPCNLQRGHKSPGVVWGERISYRSISCTVLGTLQTKNSYVAIDFDLDFFCLVQTLTVWLMIALFSQVVISDSEIFGVPVYLSAWTLFFSRKKSCSSTCLTSSSVSYGYFF